jgi:DNA-directed RNA polymerase specialized sigma24 family protein
MTDAPPRSPAQRQRKADAHRSKRRRRPVENPAFEAFLLRVIAAFGRRAATDVNAAGGLARIATASTVALGAAVRQLHADGRSCEEIAAQLKVTRQAVHKRWFAAGHHEPTRGALALFDAGEGAA